MKRTLILLILIAAVLSVQAQGTTQFTASLTGANENPPNNSRWSGVGTFSLTEDSLSYELDMPLFVYPTGGGIFDGNSILVSGFGTPIIFAPGPSGQPGGLIYFGSVTLSPQGVADLRNGNWFVNVLTSAYPNGEILGKIAPVPEPSMLVWLGLAGLMVVRPKRLEEFVSCWANGLKKEERPNASAALRTEQPFNHS